MAKNKFLDKQKGGIIGVLEIRDIDKETGEITNVYKQRNVVTLEGMSYMWQRLGERDQGTAYTFNRFVFGSDTGLEEGGDWTIFAPKPATRFYTKNNQFPVYEDFPESMVFSYPDGGVDDLSDLVFYDGMSNPYYSGELRLSNIVNVSLDTGTGIISIELLDTTIISTDTDIRTLHPEVPSDITSVTLDAEGYLFISSGSASDINLGKITLPDGNTLQVGTLIDGKFVMDTYFPNEVDVVYNSATIRFENDEVFSYKRFPVRTISRLVDVQVIWTFYLVDSALYDCSIEDDPDDVPEPDHDFGITTYAGYLGDNTVHKISPTGSTLWVYSGHTDWVTDLAIDNTYLYSVSRDMSIHVIDITNGSDFQIIPNAHADVINRIIVDGPYTITAANDSTVKKYEWASATEEWSFDPGTSSDAMDVKIDPLDGNYYAAYRDGMLYKIDSASGLEINRWDTSAELVKIAVDNEGTVYLSIFESGGVGYAVRKFEPDTSTIRWTIQDFTGYIFGLVVDSDLNVYTGDDQETVRLFDRLADELWRFERHTDIVRGLARDQFGYLYSASIDQTVRKITPNGNQVWAYTANENPAVAVITNLTPEN